MNPAWLQSGNGTAPRLAWSTRTEAAIVASATARETGATYLADESGSVYAIDRLGEITAVTRGFRDLDRLIWADDGSGGAIVTEGEQVSRLAPNLESVWSASLPGEVLGIATDPFGHHLAIGLATRKNYIMNWRNKRVAEFETMRPLRHLQFSAAQPRLLAAADQGLLCAHSLDGTQLWHEQVFSNVGDLRITGNARTILLASFNHGVQVYDADGAHRGAYMVEGTPKLVACTFTPESIAVATVERHVYWLDSDGEMKWAAQADADVVGLHCDPLGEAVLVALESGWLHRLEWSSKQ